jgi:3'-5' exoribonuclease 1
MRYVIVDLEATCWETGANRLKSEIIEIGAVLLESSKGPILREFSGFVKPVASQKLSDFCRKLTTITQAQVDSAEYFWEVFPLFLQWIGNEPFILCSWGAYDLNQFRQDCSRHKLSFPTEFEQHINLKKEFAQIMNVKICGMAQAMKIAKIELEGIHHRGIDDAKNIAKLALKILPKLEKQTTLL